MDKREEKLLVVEHLSKEYSSRQKVKGKSLTVKAVDDVHSLSNTANVWRGRNPLGKTTLGRSSAAASTNRGEMRFDIDGESRNILTLSKDELSDAAEGSDYLQDP